MIEEKRTEIRNYPEQRPLAAVGFSGSLEGFQGDLSGFVMDESSDGCGLAVPEDSRLEKGTLCVVKPGIREARISEIQWVAPFERGLVRVGIKFRS